MAEETTKPKEQPPVKTPSPKSTQLAVILVRGLIDIKKPVRDTLALLRLTRKNHCTVLSNNPVNLGMLKKVKDYVTWGEISEETFQELVEKRGEPYLGPETDSKGKFKYNRFFTFKNKKYKKYFRLNSPQKGFGRKGIKIGFKAGGTLGYRGADINRLIKNML